MRRVLFVAVLVMSLVFPYAPAVWAGPIVQWYDANASPPANDPYGQPAQDQLSTCSGVSLGMMHANGTIPAMTLAANQRTIIYAFYVPATAGDLCFDFYGAVTMQANGVWQGQRVYVEFYTLNVPDQTFVRIGYWAFNVNPGANVTYIMTTLPSMQRIGSNKVLYIYLTAPEGSSLTIPAPAPFGVK